MSSDSPSATTRRNAIKTIGLGGLAALSGIGLASSPAAARVSFPTMQRETGNLTVENKQATKIGREYTYIFTLTNTANRARRIEVLGKGPLDTLAPRVMGAGQGQRIVIQVRRPLNRIVLR